MKPLAPLILVVAVAAGAAWSLPARAATYVGVSIGINAPGQYGRVDIGNYPQVELDTPRPVIYLPSPVAVYQQPIYLYVPAVQQADWGRYCGGYRACGQPVHFVRETWIRDEYRREHEKVKKAKKHGDRHDEGRHGGRDKHRRED